MANTVYTNDTEEFITCGVCLCEFEAEVRKPKFLTCSHTVCLLCLKQLLDNGKIKCPFCRKDSVLTDPASLPNNTYALHIVKLAEEMKLRNNNYSQERSKLCFTCGTMITTVKDMQRKQKMTKAWKYGISMEDENKNIKTLASMMEKIALNTTLVSDYERKKKIKMKIFLYEEGSRRSTFLEDGFVMTTIGGSDGLANFDPLVRRELMLLWHVFHSVVQKRGFELPPPEAHVSYNPPVHLRHVTCPLTISEGTPIPRSPYVVPGGFYFIMKLLQHGVVKGVIRIHPITSFYPEFVISLADFCFKSPQVFCKGVEKAVPGVFTMFRMAHPQFRKHLPGMIAKFPHDDCKFPEDDCKIVKDITEVAINQLLIDGKNLIGWNMLFQQKNYHDPSSDNHKRSLPREGGGLRLFGRVYEEQTLRCIDQLSAASAYERNSYTITLESLRKCI